MPNWADCALVVQNGDRFFAELRSRVGSPSDHPEVVKVEEFFGEFAPMPVELSNVDPEELLVPEVLAHVEQYNIGTGG